MTKEEKIDFIADRQSIANLNSLKIQDLLDYIKYLEMEKIKREMHGRLDKEVDVLYDFFASYE